MCRWVAGLALALAGSAVGACKIEPVAELSPQAEPNEPIDFELLVVPDRRVVDEESSLIEAELRRQLSLLTSPYLGGRRPGTEGATLTAGHIERSMRQIGLAPSGVGGGWRQPVVVRVRSTEDGRIELPGPTAEAEPDVLRHGEDVVLWRTVEVAGPWSQNLGLVEVGFGIEAPALGHDDFAEVDVRGKILLVQAGVPADESFDADATARYGAVGYKLEKAAEKGAAGCLITTGALRDEAAWAETVARYGGAHVDQPSAAESTTAPPLVGMVSAEAEARLQAWLTAAAVPETPGDKRPPLRQVRADVVTSEQTIVDASIVGRIAGADRPKEVVVLLAHWDAGGLSAPRAEGGALGDNATGVAVLLTVARRSAEWTRRGHPPSRSIAFVATASDTLGIAGARALIADGPLSRSDIVAVVSLDELSARAEAPALGAVDHTASELGEILASVRPSVRVVDPSQAPHAELGHTPALQAGIAAVTLTQHDPFTTPVDTFAGSELLDPLVADVAFVFDVAWRLAESSQVPVVGAEPPPAEQDAPAPDEPRAP